MVRLKFQNIKMITTKISGIPYVTPILLPGLRTHTVRVSDTDTGAIRQVAYRLTWRMFSMGYVSDTALNNADTAHFLGYGRDTYGTRFFSLVVF